MNRLSIAVMALLLASFISHAQGTEALTFSRTNRDPVSCAMAGSDLAATGRAAFAWQRGSASLPFFEGTLDAAVSYEYFSPGGLASNNLAAGAGGSLGRLGFSGGFAADIYPEISDGDSAYSPGNLTFALGAGYMLTEKLSAGVTLMYLRQSLLSDVAYSGFNASIDAFYRISPSLDASLGIAGLGSGITDSSGNRYRQPASVRTGACWRISSLTANLSADWFLGGSWSVAAGAEYTLLEMISLRAGYRLSHKYAPVPSHLAVGAGFRMRGIGLDITYIPVGEAMANTVMAGMAYRF